MPMPYPLPEGTVSLHIRWSVRNRRGFFIHSLLYLRALTSPGPLGPEP